MIQYIADKDHYTEVLSLCEKAKHDLWIVSNCLLIKPNTSSSHDNS